MAVKLDDFFYKEPSNEKIVKYDYEKANDLSDEEFVEHYNQLMNTYQIQWKRKEKINCNKCSEKISGPRDLVRYMGANVHRGVCIKQAVESEEFWADSSKKKYFERIVDLTNTVSEAAQ